MKHDRPSPKSNRPPPKHTGTDAMAHALASAPDETLPPPAAFLEACANFGLEFDAGELDTLGRFLALMLHVNKDINLTAIREPAEAWIKHIFDALTLIPLLHDEGSGPVETLVDVGSGGGVPAIPLAITQPDIRFTLVESTGKKALFLKAAAHRLGLENVTVVSERSERFGASGGSGKGRGTFDVATARALGHAAVALELTIPLVRVGGRALLVKGERAEAELAEAASAMRTLNTANIGSVRTPTGTIVVLEKQKKTPAAYPRRDGEPKREPLGVRA